MSQIKIGLFADAQYCNCDTKGKRFYRTSLKKLEESICKFNETEKISFVVGLGDLIDQEIKSFDVINQVLDNSGKRIYNVTGNHDFDVKSECLEKVVDKLGLSEGTYYSIEEKDWQFIFLNGNEITISSNDEQIVKEAQDIIKKLKEENKPNAHDWNGGMSQTQIRWMKEQLKKAEQSDKKVILFCHYPLQPFEDHCLWNTEEIMPILGKYNCVKAWINGHNHAGNYAMKNGIHFLTLKGMVDTETENSYAILRLSEDWIEIEGFGREVNRSLQVR